MGLTSFASGLRQSGIEIFSTGGTRRTLEEAGIPAIEVASYTGFPEMLDVKCKDAAPEDPRWHIGSPRFAGTHASFAGTRDSPVRHGCRELVPIRADRRSTGLSVRGGDREH